ncbi:deoxynucleotide monophosphate kinase [Mesorhizobium sp.]|uniref:deoxynucleotide monophosphate kinase n=1 Tax=Mesorhizobium sp. TaxID=1871066 RepID=UPI000FE98AF4|nr:deoxynucleotide monophosphate kinase [Mesorhizobium sp.]RWO20632.1 MAG: deoxynucleotide monophosphate kinase [Mesorhizobium sp.]
MLAATNENIPLVVAISGVAGSGKSTAAQHLVDIHGYTRVRFAGPLKDMMTALGFTKDDTDGEAKERPHELLCGKTRRHAMQTLGTEWGRKCIGEDFWVGLWRRAADDVIASGGRVVVDDCRFPNEAVTVRRIGGDIYRIVGRGGLVGGHESERMDFIPDVVIENTSDILALWSKVDEALTRWG